MKILVKCKYLPNNDTICNNLLKNFVPMNVFLVSFIDL